jgi:hypothetical protein
LPKEPSLAGTLSANEAHGIHIDDHRGAAPLVVSFSIYDGCFSEREFYFMYAARIFM